MEYQAFLLLAMPEAVDENIKVGLAGKDIHPVHHGKGDEVDGLPVSDFVATDAHGSFGCTLNLLLLIGKGNTPFPPVLSVNSLGMLAVVYNYGPDYPELLVAVYGLVRCCSYGRT
jgi:hypothetical protein